MGNLFHRLELDGNTYELDKNHGSHHLHGCTEGYFKQVFNIESQSYTAAAFLHLEPAGNMEPLQWSLRCAAANSIFGLAKNGLKDYEGAIEDYSKAIEKYPENAEAFNKRGGPRTS